MKSVKFRYEGTSPMMMCSIRGANPLSPYAKEMSRLHAAGRLKTADKEAILIKKAEVEWECGLNHDETEGDFCLGPYIPADYVRANLQQAARLSKQGKTIERGVSMVASRFKLLYNGPRRLEELREDPRFRDQRMVCIQGRSKILKTRPIFPEWALNVEVYYLPSVVDRKDLIEYARRGGQLIGLGDARSIGFGRFSTKVMSS